MEIKELFDRYALDWSDEFDYEGRPDPEKWDYEVGNHQWYNNELQAYTDKPENVFVSGGRLHIVALKKKDGEREYTSTRMVTYGKRDFTKGLFEIRCKLPKGQGSWPAIWLLGSSIKTGTPWPRCGEIDIVEHAARWQDELFFSLHTNRHNHTRKDTKQYSTIKKVAGVSEDFHDYLLEWTDDYMEFYVDGISCCRYNKSDDTEDQSAESWPFDEPHFMICNIAVGGTMGGDVDDSTLPYEMEVEHIRYYKPKD